ncbi:MAG: hypothetical protein E6093_09790 [Serratia liquefaciens]|nr:hypothetical protein [Serratia liquefaciens]HEJ7042967.1 hypothetical protein [Serratia liquefaciens]
MAENVITDNDLIEKLYNLESRVGTFNDEWDAFLDRLRHIVEKYSNEDGTQGFSELKISNSEDKNINLTLLDTFNFTIERVVRGKTLSILVYELLGNDIDGKRIKEIVLSYKHTFGEGWENGPKRFASSKMDTREFVVSLMYKLIEHVNK